MARVTATVLFTDLVGSTELGNSQALSRAVLANTRGFFYTRTGAVDVEKTEMLEAALRLIGDTDARIRSRLLDTLGLELLFADSQRALALSDQALALAPRTIEKRSPPCSLPASSPLHIPGLLDERLANTAELLTTVKPDSDPALAAEAHLVRGRAVLEAGDIEEADRCFGIADKLSAGLGQPALRYRVLYILAARAIIAGCLPEAERLLLQSRELGHGVQVEADWIFAVQLWSLRLEQGRRDEEVIRLLEAATGDVDVPLNDSTFALAACEIGQHTEAEAAVTRHARRPVRFDLYFWP